MAGSPYTPSSILYTSLRAAPGVLARRRQDDTVKFHQESTICMARKFSNNLERVEAVTLVCPRERQALCFSLYLAGLREDIWSPGGGPTCVQMSTAGHLDTRGNDYPET